MNKFIVGLLAGISFFSCDYQTTTQECCQCLTDNQCTDVLEERCLDVFRVLYGQDSIEVKGDCVKNNECYSPCALSGAYFDKRKMIFKK